MTDNSAAPDNDLQLKKRARRRLVGAIALALLAAIVLPMVMDHEPRPTQQDIQVRIPSQDAGNFTSRVLPGATTATPLPPVPAAKPTEPEASEPDTASAAANKPVPKVEIKPAPKPELKSAAKPENKAKPKSPEALRAEHILSGGTDASALAPTSTAAPAPKSEQWVLQLGAYQDQGNVKLLQAKVKEFGYPSYTEKVSTPQGERTRVRAGPFPSKAAAEKAQAALKKIGAGGPPGGVLVAK